MSLARQEYGVWYVSPTGAVETSRHLRSWDDAAASVASFVANFGPLPTYGQDGTLNAPDEVAFPAQYTWTLADPVAGSHRPARLVDAVCRDTVGRTSSSASGIDGESLGEFHVRTCGSELEPATSDSA